jgi:hypothetical protein
MSLLDEIDPCPRELATRPRETMSTITDGFEDDCAEMDLSHRVERLQGIICCLLSRNEELRAAVEELKQLRFEQKERTSDD